MSHQHLRSALGLLSATLFAFAPSHALAERPMVVDDASTLAAGDYKLEAGWNRDDRHQSLEAAAGMSPIDTLELEVGLARGRDRDADLRSRGTGFAIKWVPFQSDTGPSFGFKYSYGNEREREDGHDNLHSHGHALTALFSWRFGSGQVAHLNLGREWARDTRDTDAESLWGVGLEQPLTDTLTLTAETFGTRHGRPDQQIGLRYEIVEGVKLSGAIGRGNHRTLANLGIAWEF